MSARRFSAQAASSLAGGLRLFLAQRNGFDLASDTPRAVIALRTASARFWPRARLYSVPPRSSVLPWIRILRSLVLGQVAEWFSTTGLPSSRTA